MTTIRFNVNAQRFINEKGVFIKEEFVLNTLSGYRTQNIVSVNKILELTTFDNLDESYKEVSKKIRDAWVIEYIVGKGGVKQLDNDDIKLLNTKLKNELTLAFSIDGKSYGLQELYTQYEQGEISQEQFVARVQAYARGSRKAYYLGQDSRQTLPYVQRALHGNNNCNSCISYAAAGIVSRGSIPLPGEACECLSNCNCTIAYLSDKQYKTWLKQQINSFTEAVVTP